MRRLFRKPAPFCSCVCHLSGSWNSPLDPLYLREECGKRARGEDPGRFLEARPRGGAEPYTHPIGQSSVM